jgi:hypothetical protein
VESEKVLGEMEGYSVRLNTLENGETLLELRFSVERVLLPINSLFILQKLINKASSRLLRME